MFFLFQNNPKNLDPSYNMDLGFGDCFGRVKPPSHSQRNTVKVLPYLCRYVLVVITDWVSMYPEFIIIPVCKLVHFYHAGDMGQAYCG